MEPTIAVQKFPNCRLYTAAFSDQWMKQGFEHVKHSRFRKYHPSLNIVDRPYEITKRANSSCL